MDPETTPQQENSKKEEIHTTPILHTYQDDLAKAMDATDATVVQQLLADAREREHRQEDEATRKKQRGWYSVTTILLILLALGIGGYGIYHYQRLTVPVEQAPSVGVFPQTDPIVVSDTDIRALMVTLQTATTLEEGKPTLVQLVRDTITQTPLSKPELFSFFETRASEPFLGSFGVLHLGVLSLGTKTVPFIIGSVPDREVASKELLIAEPDLLRMLYAPLGIPLNEYTDLIGKTFSQNYVYNLPTRTLVVDTETGEEMVLFYGYATDNVVVFSTDYEVLKRVYDSVISQQ
jgi:hypothetical protein